MRHVALYAEYGDLIPGLVFRGHVFGCQFHPEKSGTVGLRILRNFCELD
jgi:glutamine amidotransferase